MNDSHTTPAASRLQSGYPLASLALLVTLLACVFACTDLEQWGRQYEWLKEDWPWRLVALFGGAGLFGGLIGSVYVFVLSSTWRSGLLALAAGIVAGMLGALILVAPGPIWRTLVAVCVLMGTAVVFRLDAE